MSHPDAPRYEPHRRIRVILGPLFGVACFLATLSGVVVLAVLLGAVFAAVLRRPDARSWTHFGANLRDLFQFLVALVTHLRSRNPAVAGFRAGLAGSLWLLGMVALFAIPVGVGAAVFLEEYVPAGRIRKIMDIDLPRPRHYQVMSSPEAFEYKREAMELLHHEAMRSFRPFQARRSPGIVQHRYSR